MRLSSFGSSAQINPNDPRADAAPPASSPLPSWVAPVVIVGALGLVGMVVYFKFKTTQAIIQKEGVGKALAFEAGTTGLSMLQDAMTSRARRNGRRRRRARRNGKSCSCNY